MPNPPQLISSVSLTIIEVISPPTSIPPLSAFIPVIDTPEPPCEVIRPPTFNAGKFALTNDSILLVETHELYSLLLSNSLFPHLIAPVIVTAVPYVVLTDSPTYIPSQSAVILLITTPRPSCDVMSPTFIA